ncbi:MAG: oligosaccharide flippase family protein, partial [Deltaproteobacteria bacterium]|nr:oligosaccharide flippase family protein [Deltaproteobacteria bacterium]
MDIKTLLQETKKTFRLGLPIAFGFLCIYLNNTIDTIMVGRLGPEQLATMALALTPVRFIMMFTIGILSALSPLISRFYGANDIESIQPVVHQGIFIALSIGIIAGLIVFFADHFFICLGQPNKIIPEAKKYLIAVGLGFPPAFVYICFKFFCESISDSKAPMRFVLISIAVNIFFNYCLIYGNLGFPALGALGSGIATCAVNYFLCIGLGLHIHLHPRYRAYGIFHHVPV